MALPFTTLRDLLRFGVSRFTEAGLSFGHGSSNAYDEAAYLILHTLHLPLDTLDPFLDARLLDTEIDAVMRSDRDAAQPTACRPRTSRRKRGCTATASSLMNA